MRRLLLMVLVSAGAACVRDGLRPPTEARAPTPGASAPAGPGGKATPPAEPPHEAALLARATLPWDTFSPGPPAGARLPGHPSGAPWPSQPVQGFSGLVALPDAGFLTVTDNGFGTKENSSDFLVRVYALAADFDAGTLAATERCTLADPRRVLPFPVVNEFTEARLLTGADVDVESLVLAPDGTFWFGDEFGPFLLHADARCALLEAPIELPDEDGGVLSGPDHPSRRSNLMLKALEALRADARSHPGRDAGAPVLSPDEALLDDAAQVRSLHAAGFRVVPWTVNDPARMEELLAWGVDGLITDRPDLLLERVDGGVDVQGHRGARGLVPENTLPAFETALALGVGTLELDVTATASEAPMVWHDPVAAPPKCRGAPDGGLLLPGAGEAELRALVCDGRLAEFPEQRAATSYPASRAVLAAAGRAELYALAPLDAVLALPAAWAQEQRRRGKPELAALAEARAAAVRFNVETKLSNTTSPHDTPEWLTRTIASHLEKKGLTPRATLQSFDWRSLRVAHAEFPGLGTVLLLGKRTAALPAEARAGLPWPERELGPARVQRSGGFEGLALTAQGTRLVALLEKPLADARSRELLAFGFDLDRRRFDGVEFRVPLAPRATAVGDLVMVDAVHGFLLERDDADGTPGAFKHLTRLTLPEQRGGLATVEDAADLLALEAPGGPFSFPFQTIEGVAALPGGRLALVNDNNFPFGRARHPGGDEPDGTELIILTPRH